MLPSFYMAALSKSQKVALREARREARAAAKDQIMDARMRTAAGFAGAYLLTQALPSFAPSFATNQSLIDAGLALGGAYLAFTDDGEIGDFATGAAMVGAIQTLDNVGAKIQEWAASRNAA